MAIRLLQGIHVPHRKNTSKCVPVRMPAPAKVMIPVSMHIGAPAKANVQAGDKVNAGDVIAAAADGLSVNIHASVSGVVKEVTDKYVLIGLE